MEIGLVLFVGIIVGGAAGWLLAGARLRGVFAGQLAQAQGAARAAEEINAELRRQIGGVSPR